MNAGLRLSEISPVSTIASVALGLFFLLAVYLMPMEWAGWLVICASFGAVVYSRDLRKDMPLTLAAVAVVAAHYLVSVINMAIVTLPGSELDAQTFHHLAVNLAGAGKLYFEVGYEFYVNLLGLFYIALGPSQLLGQGLSILAFTLSCIVFVRLLDLYAIKDYRWVLLLFYGLMPSTLLLTSFTLREAWQLLFFELAVLCGLRFIANRKIRWLIALMVFAVALALLHRALLLYSVCLVLFFMAGYVIYRPGPRSTLARQGLVVLLVGAICIGLAWLAIEWTEVGKGFVSILSRLGIVNYIDTYRMQLEFLGEPRTTFNVAFDSSTAISTIMSIVKFQFYYLFSPLTGGGGLVKDVYAMAEALLRAVLIVFAVVTWFFSRGDKNYRYGIILLIYASMTFMWALGTTNYGQALRHHVLTNWLLILAGMPALLYTLRGGKKA